MIILDVFIRSMFLIRFWNYFYIDIPRIYVLVGINKNIPVPVPYAEVWTLWILIA